MRRLPKKKIKLVTIIGNHVKDNLKAYLIISLILLIGIVLGVIFVNHLNDTQKQEIQNYLTEFTNSLKQGAKINNLNLLTKSIGNSLLLAFLMWFVGSTVIGIPIVMGIVIFRGFCLGYTISAVIGVWGIGKGLLFFVSSLLLQTLLTIPCIIALAVSGLKLYKSIMKDKRKENIKFEIIRHTIFSLIILVVLILASLIEAYISSNLLTMCVNYLL